VKRTRLYRAIDFDPVGDYTRALHAEIDRQVAELLVLHRPGVGALHDSLAELLFDRGQGVRLLDWVNNAVNDVTVETVDCDPNCGTP
jgi:hypothetical protein